MKQSGSFQIQYLFYILGVIFLLWTVAYFSYEYVFNLANEIKAVVLVCLTIIFFFIADFLAERDI